MPVIDAIEHPLKALFQSSDVNRQMAWDQFLHLDLPKKRFNKLYTHPFKNAEPVHPGDITTYLLPECQNSYCVFVNGCYLPDLSKPPKEIIALPLTLGLKTYGSFLNARHTKQLKEEKDPFAALNGALYQEGLFLYLPPKVLCEAPLQILHFIDGDDCVVSPRLHLFMGRESSLSLAMTRSGAGKNIWINGYADFALEERASLTLTSLSEEEKTTTHFEAIRATLKRQSQLKSWSVTNGGALSKQDYVVRLSGEECDASLYGAWGLEGNKEHHVNILMDHQEPNTTSLQTFKGILADKSHSSFEGKIYVHQKAQKTQAYQMNRNLILSKYASAYCKPNLEIFADDVKASHGATIGQLDDEHLFYLRARGIPQSVARALLVQAFTQEIVDPIPLASLRALAIQLMSPIA